MHDPMINVNGFFWAVAEPDQAEPRNYEPKNKLGSLSKERHDNSTFFIKTTFVIFDLINKGFQRIFTYVYFLNWILGGYWNIGVFIYSKHQYFKAAMALKSSKNARSLRNFLKNTF